MASSSSRRSGRHIDMHDTVIASTRVLTCCAEINHDTSSVRPDFVAGVTSKAVAVVTLST